MHKLVCSLVVLVGIGAVLVISGCGEEPPEPPAEITRPSLDQYNRNSNMMSLNGYSPVSYLDEGKAKRGSKEYIGEYEGIYYSLTSMGQQQKFDANPEKYEPAFGGWCAYSMAQGKKVDVHRDSFKVVDGRLLVFSKDDTTDGLTLWNEGDEAELMKKAEEHWKSMIGG